MTSYMMSNDCAQCYGCRACEQICPQHAVSIRENSEGFLYPDVSLDKCIDCGLCSRVCPYDAATPTQMPIKAMAVQNKDREVLLNSSSGGIFSALADYFLSKDGYMKKLAVLLAAILTSVVANAQFEQGKLQFEMFTGYHYPKGIDR